MEKIDNTETKQRDAPQFIGSDFDGKNRMIIFERFIESKEIDIDIGVSQSHEKREFGLSSTPFSVASHVAVFNSTKI